MDEPVPAEVPLSELLGRLEAHACMHDDLALYDDEQAKWAADLRAAKGEIERLHSALHELVLLKEKKQHAESLACGGFRAEMFGGALDWEPKKAEHDALMAEYNTRKEPAWAAARAALRPNAEVSGPTGPAEKDEHGHERRRAG